MATKELNNTTAGLAGLLQGVYTGIQNNRANSVAQGQLANQTQETAWKNPYRTPSALDQLGVLKANPFIQAQAAGTPQGQAILQQLISSAPVGQQSPLPGVVQAQNAQANTQAMTTNSAAPIQPIDWTQASPEDFTSWQAEMKKRASAKAGI